MPAPRPMPCTAVRIGMLALVAVTLSSPQALGQLAEWNGANAASGQNWSRDQNWSPSGAPVSGDTLTFTDPSLSHAMIQDVAGLTGLNLSFVSGNYSLTGTAVSASALTIASGAGFYLDSYIMAGPSAVSLPGTLGGAGTISGSSITVNSTGRVSPGGTVADDTGVVTQTVGILNVGTVTSPGSVTFQPSSTYAVDIGSHTVTSNIDFLSIIGTLSLDPGSILAVNNLAGAPPNDTTTRDYVIATANGGISGDPSTVVIVPTGFSSAATFSLAVQGNNLVLSYTPVPEPLATLAVFAVGLGAVGGLRRYRRQQLAVAV